MRRRRTATAFAAALATTAALLVGSAPGQAAAAAPLPTRLTHIGTARQVIVVTASSSSTSYASLTAWQKDSAGQWSRVRGLVAVPARLGWAGFIRASSRRQSDGKTPAGTFTVQRAFGSLANPGAHLPYTRFTSRQYWVYDPRDPATYNTFQWGRVAASRWRATPDWSEHLAAYAPLQYRYAAVIDFNMPGGLHWDFAKHEAMVSEPADTRLGGGIFLHVGNGGPTAGCVSVSQTAMLTLMRWMKPAMGLRIVMGPSSVITTM